MSPQEFIDRAVDSGVIQEKEVRTLLDGLPAAARPDHVTKMGRLLVQRGLLTRHQAAEVFKGAGQSLVLGNYVILDKIGEGGMGEVFRARHRVMDRIVAIKVLSQAMIESPEVVRRFHREVRVAAKLIHPNIVTAYDAAEDQGRHFLVMEFVDGPDLAEILDRDGPLSIEDAVDFTIQAAEGLGYAHAQGIIHRDVKPRNMLVSEWAITSSSQSGLALDARSGPIVKILDMGLVRLEQAAREGDEATEQFSFTQENQIMGTVDYMSPEQAENTHGADQRSDVYSLGCTLYRILTGTSPYGGDTAMSKLIAHREHPIPSLADTREDAPVGLDAVFATMVAKRPEDRYQTMGEVIEALRPYSSHAMIVAEDAADDGGPVTDDSALWQFMQAQQSASSLGQSDSIPSAPSPPAESGAPDSRARSAPAAAPPQPRKRTDTDIAVQADQTTTRHARGTTAARRRKPGLALHVVGALIGGCLAILIAFGVVAGVWLRPTTRATDRAVLQIDWPAAERQDGKLLVNDEPVELAGEDPLEVKVEPGPCSVVAMRRGFHTIHMDLAVSAGEKRPVALAWTPIPDLTLPTIDSFDPDRETKEAALVEEWVKLFAQHEDRKAKLSDARKSELAAVEKQVDAALQGDPDEKLVAAAREAAAKFLAQHGGTAEAVQLGALLQRLPEPADAASRDAIAARELTIAGAGNPADAPSQVVAILGDSRLLHADTHQYAVAFAPDNEMFATAGRSRVVRLWDAQTGEDKMRLNGHTGEVFALAFGPRGELLASGGRDKTIRLWDLSKQKSKLTLRSTNAMDVSSLVFDPDGKWLASGSKDQLIRIWNVETAQRQKEISDHTGDVVALAVSPDGQWLASSTAGGEVKIHSTASWQPHSSATTDGVPVHSLAFHPQGDRLVGGLGNGNASVWNLDGELQRTLDWGQGPIFAVQFNPTGELLAAQSSQGSCRIWKFEDGKVDLEFDTGGQYMALSGDGKLLATCTQTSPDVHLWTNLGQPRFQRQGHAGQVNAVAFTADGKQLVSAGFDATLRVWDAASRRLMHTLREHTGSVNALACSPDGNQVATAGNDKTVRVWSLKSATQLQSLTGHAHHVLAVAYSPDGRWLASAGVDKTIRLWDARTRLLKHELIGHHQAVRSMAISGDSAFLATGSDDGEVRIWTVEDGELRLVLKDHNSPLHSLAFHPDGKSLASAGADRRIVLTDLAAGEMSAELVGHGHTVVALAFTPDGSMLISAAAAPGDKRGELMIWDAASQSALRRIDGPLGPINALALGPGGRYIATAHGNGTVEILRAKSLPQTP